MMYLLYGLLKKILFMEQEWNAILVKKEIELNEQQKRLDSLFKIFDILAVRKNDIPDKDDFILKFKRVDLAMIKPGEDLAKLATIEKDE